MATAITIDRLTKTFGAGSSRAVAVDGVSLEVSPGELFFLLGPSGCGKTTLLRMIAGFIEPTSGRILLGGRDVTGVAANRRNTGMVFQSYALWPHMTVESNVAFGLDVRRIPAAERARRVAEALDAVRMSDYAKRRPNQLSGGQQQRVALARALVVRPAVLLLDEPLSNLDAKLRIELRAEIRRICKDFAGEGASGPGITTLYVTHDQKEALSMADRIAIMDRGRVVQLGSPEGLYRHPSSRFVAEFLGETNLIPGRLIQHAGEVAVIETAIGRLTAESSAAATSARSILCSIRPEAIRVAEAGIDERSQQPSNRFRGRIVETTYLGEMAQHVVEAGGLRLKVATINPGEARLDQVSLTVAARDVVVVSIT